ncbi:uncharacterized protein TMBIM7P isoform X4 [Callithrix jacchus]|uniref:uncharacterized protein TMBIM7P isoform X4 n=1 Tax=Callithrix jacchus TaxID=9483 RepID=UPI0023DD4B04|nr:uncharacterized protein TMBIM7P isoform X4 [Callithrix jacchus]
MTDHWLRSWESYLRAKRKPHFVIQAPGKYSFVRKTQLPVALVLFLILSALKILLPVLLLICKTLERKSTWFSEHPLVPLSSAGRLLSLEEPKLYQKDKYFLFSSKSFIIKVFLILSVQLVITMVITSVFIFWEALKVWVLKTPWFIYTIFPAFFLVFIMLACCGNLRRQVPANYILLGVFTVLQGLLLGAISAFYKADEVLWATAATALVTLALTLFALHTKWDFTLLNGGLFVFCFVLLVYGIILIFVPSYWLHLLYAGLGTVLFSLGDQLSQFPSLPGTEEFPRISKSLGQIGIIGHLSFLCSQRFWTETWGEGTRSPVLGDGCAAHAGWAPPLFPGP